MRTKMLSKGKNTFVDDEDFEKINKWKWNAMLTHSGNWYAMRTINYRKKNGKKTSTAIMMHRFIMGLKTGDPRQVDHIDHNGLNNQKSNLRICNNGQNKHHQKSKNKFVGITRQKGSKIHPYKAAIEFNKKVYYLGCFATPEQAAHAYDAAAIKYFGEFAHLNFPIT